MPQEDFFAEQLREVPLVAILRGMDPDTAVRAATDAWDCGVRLVEVTLERAQGVEALCAVIEAASAHRPVGAGTVTDAGRLEQARQVGAAFAIAPGLDPDTVQAARDHAIPFLPGIATPTEAGHAQRLGVTTVKLFPAAPLGPAWLRALAEPFPGLSVVATGGINADNAQDFLTAGALGVGSALRGAAAPDLVRAVRRPAG